MDIIKLIIQILAIITGFLTALISIPLFIRLHHIFYLSALGFAAAALRKWFHIYSIVTSLVLLFFGVFT